MAVGLALGQSPGDVLAYTTDGPAGSRITSTPVTHCDTIISANGGVSWAVNDLASSWIQFNSIPPYKTARRIIVLQYSTNKTNWYEAGRYQQSTRITSVGFVSSPVFEFKPLSLPLSVTRAVYVRVLDRYEVYTGEVVGTPAWQSAFWVRDAYKTRIWSPVSGYNYPNSGQDCILAPAK
jgi:hypothetical protein